MKRFTAIFLICAVLLTASVWAVPINHAEEEAQRIADLNSKWDALTARQKKRVCRLFEQRGEDEIAIAEEFARLGLLTKEEADTFAEQVENWLNSLEESENLPPIPGIPRH